ncbi:MAG: LysR family transcriptional regulator [Legionellaceae bacterium]|nr:LysR family transcriptional regulator [Legionellaceae bacterium]
MIDPHLHAFQAIVKQGTVHAAASMIHLTQTAVTQRIKALEQKLGTTLFIRSRRGMELTPEGEALHRYCQQILELNGQLMADIQGSGVTTDIRMRIAGPTSLMRSRIIPSCEPVMRAFPGLRMSFIVDDATNIHHRLKSGEAELVILSPEHLFDELSSKTLYSEHYVLLCSSKWKSRTLHNIIQEERIIDFEDDDRMTFNYLKTYNLFEHAKTERHFVNNTESLAYLITAGIGYGVLTKEFAKPYIERGEIMILNDAKTYEHKIALAWYPRLECPNYFSAILNAID